MGCNNSLSTKYNNDINFSPTLEQAITDENPILKDSSENFDQLDLKQFHIIPASVAYVKTGNTLCSNGKVLLFQNGIKEIDFRIAPMFHPSKIAWDYGVLRDIIWCHELGVFGLLTRDNLFTIDPQPLYSPETANKTMVDLIINAYSAITPGINNKSFWRCAFARKTLYVIYSDYATVIDEYSFGAQSPTFVKRWTSPETCATHEGIRCIRYQPKTDQLGLIIMDKRNNQWHFEVRDRQNLTHLWHIPLPFLAGDCEISPLGNGDWLAINSCGRNLLQIANQKFKPLLEYGRYLKNATVINNSYFAVRGNNTIAIHRTKLLK